MEKLELWCTIGGNVKWYNVASGNSVLSGKGKLPEIRVGVVRFTEKRTVPGSAVVAQLRPSLKVRPCLHQAQNTGQHQPVVPGVRMPLAGSPGVPGASML